MSSSSLDRQAANRIAAGDPEFLKSRRGVVPIGGGFAELDQFSGSRALTMLPTVCRCRRASIIASVARDAGFKAVKEDKEDAMLSWSGCTRRWSERRTTESAMVSKKTKGNR